MTQKLNQEKIQRWRQLPVGFTRCPLSRSEQEVMSSCTNNLHQVEEVVAGECRFLLRRRTFPGLNNFINSPLSEYDLMVNSLIWLVDKECIYIRPQCCFLSLEERDDSWGRTPSWKRCARHVQPVHTRWRRRGQTFSFDKIMREVSG